MTFSDIIASWISHAHNGEEVYGVRRLEIVNTGTKTGDMHNLHRITE